MIYDDQPQMMEAAKHRSYKYPPMWAVEIETSVIAAFAAIDRDALIEKAIVGLPLYRAPNLNRHDAEAVLVAAGIIPERT